MAKSYKIQKESLLQRQIIDYLHAKPELGCFMVRIKNGATYDPTNHAFRANTSTKGIPDLLGVHKNGQAIAIEVKYIEDATHPPKPSKEQREILQEYAKRSPFVGVAYSLEDAYAICANDPVLFPRNVRTYNYLERAERRAYERPDGTKKTKAVRARKKEKSLNYLCPWMPKDPPKPPELPKETKAPEFIPEPPKVEEF